MQYPAFITITGERQGLISAGASSKDSISHNWQANQDVIRVYSLSHQQCLTNGQREHCPFEFTKEIDKASPLLRQALKSGERLPECHLKLYRINQSADYEHFLSIILTDAVVASVHLDPVSRVNLAKPLRERVTVRYRKIQYRHEVASTSSSDIWEGGSDSNASVEAINANPFVNTPLGFGNPANFMNTEPDWMRPKTSETSRKEPPEKPTQCFLSSCELPDGEINYPDGQPKPVEPIKNYGNFAVMAGSLGSTKGIASLTALPSSAPVSTLFGDLRLGLRIGATALQGTATAIGTSALGMLGLLWSPKLGDSEIHYTEEQLRQMSQARTRARMTFQTSDSGVIEGYGFYTGDNPEWEMVDVINVRSVGSEMVADLGDGIEIVWTPQADPADAPTTPPLEADYQTPTINIFPTAEQAAQVYDNPAIPTDYKDAILIFPADTGIPPLYVVFKTGPRYEPGVVTGKGEDIIGTWLETAGVELGSPIPSQIADRLRGREFANFGEFRKVFWKSIASDQELSSQFEPQNLSRMKSGKALKRERVTELASEALLKSTI